MSTPWPLPLVPGWIGLQHSERNDQLARRLASTLKEHYKSQCAGCWFQLGQRAHGTQTLPGRRCCYRSRIIQGNRLNGFSCTLPVQKANRWHSLVDLSPKIITFCPSSTRQRCSLDCPAVSSNISLPGRAQPPDSQFL